MIVIKLGKVQRKEVNQSTINVNFSIMKANKTETYVSDVIDNNVSES